MQTYVPKRYQVSEETIAALDKTIMTLFELLDSDNDGLITWQEFYQYYSISCDESDSAALLPHVKYSKKHQVFKYIQKNSDQQSGKTGKVTVDTLIENYNEVADLPGVKILNIIQLSDNFYITTDTGLYQYDSMFLFPKTIFEPSLQLIQINTRQTQKIDEKKFIQNLKNAENDLGKMGVQIPTFQRKHLDDGSQNMKQLQKLTVSPTVQNCKTIIASEYLSPYGIFAVTTQYPGLFFVNTKAQVSDFFELESTVTHLRWDEISNSLYIGHVSGKVSAYKLSFLDETQIRENEEKELERKRAQERSKSFLDKLYTIFDKKGLPHKRESVYKLQKHELASLYPEMQQLYVQTSMNTEEIKAKKAKIQQQIDEIMSIKAEDFELSNLVSSIIFHMDHSVVDLNHINLKDMIKSDPQAYLQACTNMVRLDNLYKVQKHGKVKLSVQLELIASNYVVSGPIKCMDIGRGRWEAYIQSRNLLRIVVSSTDGSILVLDEVFNEIASFPNMYDDGIINVHVCEDNIITVGYEEVYLIDGDAVSSAHKGFVIVKESDKEAMAELNEEELVEGNLVKAYTRVRLLQPPRPGTPIMYSFLLGDVLGVIDHQNILTLSYAFTGAHIARTSCNLPDLQLSRFGQCSYNYTKDIGYLPVGKMVFYVKAEPNEDIEEDNNIMDVLSLQQKEDEKVAQNSVYQENVPIGTANRKLLCSCFNQIQNELALVTDDLEVTIYSLNTGHPVRVINLETYQDDYAITYKQNDYTSIESNDLNQYLSDTKLKSSKKRGSVQDDLQGNAKDNHLKPESRSRSLPTGKLPNILSQKKQKAFNSILDMVGTKIFGISTNSKGTILYIFGETGTLTLYWDTGKLFDMNNVNIVGLKVQGLPDTGVIKNPFQVQKVSMLEKEKIENDTQLKEGYLSTFSLNVRFDDVIKQQNGYLKNTNIKQRSIMLCADKTHGRCFVNDSLVPDRVFQIATEISKDFFDKPENTRVLNILRLQKQNNIDIATYDPVKDRAQAGQPLVCDFKASIRQYFSSSANYKGLIDNMYGLQKISKFICQDFINKEKIDQYPKNQTFFQRFLHEVVNELDVEQFSVTTMDVSPQLGLIACGTTEGTVQLYDSYVNMLPSGYISVPYLSTRPAITSLKFCGDYPVLFIGTQDGGIYLYTVRPYMPSGQLVCAFQHGNYHPIDRPMDIDFVRKTQQMRGFIKIATRIARWTSNQYTIAKNKQEDVIKHILFNQQIDLRGSKYVRNTYISQFFEDYIERTRAQSELENSTPAANQQINPLDDSGQIKQISSMTTIDPKRFAQGTRQIYSYNGMQNAQGQLDQQKQQQGKDHNSKAHLHDYSRDIAQINEALWAMASSAPQENRTQSAVSGKSGKSGSKDPKKSQKTKRIIYKIQAAVSLLGGFLALMDLGMIQEGRKPVYLFEKIKKEEITDMQQGIQDINGLFQNAALNAKKISKLKQKHEISLAKTEQFLRVQQKNQYRSKKEDTDARVLKVPDDFDDYSGTTGLVYKRMYQEDTMDLINVPVRIADHNMLRTRVAPTSFLYDQQSQQLIVGDENGFITHYCIEKLIKQAQLKPIQPNILTIQTDTGVETVSRGYLPQHLPKDQNSYQKNLQAQGMFSAELLVRTICSYRAHRSKVSQLESLVGSGIFMSVGEDRRVLCFEIHNGALKGSVQRVQLQQASPSVSKYFCNGVGCNGLISQLQYQQKNKLVHGIHGRLAGGANDVSNYQVPPSRLEFPPACKFTWNFQTVVEKMSQEQLIDADLFQGVPEKDRIKGRGQAVPIYDQNPHTALLQSTGLTTQALQKHSDTWTVRAIIKRALGKCNPEEATQQAQQQQQDPAPKSKANDKKNLKKQDSIDSITTKTTGKGTENPTEIQTEAEMKSSVVHIDVNNIPIDSQKQTPRASSVDRAQLTKEILTAFAPQTAKTDVPIKHNFRRGGMKDMKISPVDDIEEFL